MDVESSADTPKPQGSASIAVIGDVHLHWNDFDVEYFNQSDYDLILFVGDIAAYRHRSALAIAQSMAELRRPTLMIPGNHDAVHVGQLVAEVFERPNVSARIGGGQRRRRQQIDRALGQIELAGYSRHLVAVGDFRFSVVAARPHSMGGPRVAFRRHLQEQFGVDSLESSTRRIIELVEQCDAEPIVFLAHNGPSGLGDRREDPWGCDFRDDIGDFGDPDLAQAVSYARSSGRRVLAVIAGHMHHHLRGGGQRTWLARDEAGTLYLNAARVPRIFNENDATWHHHVEVRLARDSADCFERRIVRSAATA